MAGNVILGYDGSDGSKAALRVAVRAAHAFEAGLVVVFGYEPSPTSGESSDYRHEIHRIGDEAVTEAVGEAHELDPSVSVERLVVPMKAVDALLEAAEEREAIAIVVGGSSSSGPIVGAILGSVPYKLLHRTTVPVLVVPVGPD
jgi:nucleotide-binding universal stress UspA family protein